jgi:hypothetical protein
MYLTSLFSISFLSQLLGHFGNVLLYQHYPFLFVAHH